MNYRSAIFTKDGRIDAEINHPDFGWIPCTFSIDDEPTAWLFHASKDYATAYVELED